MARHAVNSVVQSSAMPEEKRDGEVLPIFAREGVSFLRMQVSDIMKATGKGM